MTMPKPKAALTPLMKQYYNVKDKHPDAILLFRVGDFYETFEEDAVKASQILGITLAKRANGSASYVDLAGFPHHALDTYLPKLVRAGQRVAICEQLEDPKLTKKIVKRGITELITPGITFNENVIEHKSNNFLCSLYLEKKTGGIAFLDITTGEFLTTQGTFQYLEKLLFSFQPKEVIYLREQKEQILQLVTTKFYTYPLEDWAYKPDNCYEQLTSQLGTKTLKGFGIEPLRDAITAAGAILNYLDLTEHKQLNHIQKISRIDSDNFMWLDQYTIRNLELFSPISQNGKTLIDTIDFTVSAMGGRMLKKWMSFPLIKKPQIDKRLNVVEFFVTNNDLRHELRQHIKEIADLERLVSRLAAARISPREIVQLKRSLFAINNIKALLAENQTSELQSVVDQINPCKKISERIHKELTGDPPNSIGKGKVIEAGVSVELDELRILLESGKDYLVNLQKRESEKTGITSLKVAYNNVFGYYIEVRNTHKEKVPEAWIRKQTLVSAERYITQELKEYETKILGAEEKILILETTLFQNLINSIFEYIPAIQLNAELIAQLDCLLGFAEMAVSYNYNKPDINETNAIEILQGRHPVIEKQMPIGESYIPNDVFLDDKKQQIIIITGPNMAGKSALLRQTALIVLLAQSGSFIPAKSAKIGIVDKIFTRVGASDNIALGESTFMTEMTETASILNNFSNNSLVLLDEIGRGTSTYDGISIAWAITEYLHEHHTCHPKTMFATHYHELNEMEKSFKRIKNFHISVKEIDGKIIFDRKFKEGGTAHSFGIHVADMAGIPKSVVNRSKAILLELEGSTENNTLGKPIDDIKHNKDGYQLSFFQLDDPLLLELKEMIKQINLNNLTPIEALNLLNDIQKKLK